LDGEKMSTTTVAPQLQNELLGASIQQQISTTIDDLIAQLPNPERLSPEQRRGIIARYSAVLEGNFIYWMTAAYIAVKCEQVRPILAENLFEEVRDAHPVMLRKFAIAAHAFPTDKDALAIDEELKNVRFFLGKLQGVQSVLTMAFFEGWIQRFMGYLADLAGAQGSSEREYTDVHGVCDVTHTAELFRALSLEMAANPTDANADLFEGVDLLRTLINAIVHGVTANVAA
jgi:Iron-containing redox enzyme